MSTKRTSVLALFVLLALVGCAVNRNRGMFIEKLADLPNGDKIQAITEEANGKITERYISWERRATINSVFLIPEGRRVEIEERGKVLKIEGTLPPTEVITHLAVKADPNCGRAVLIGNNEVIGSLDYGAGIAIFGHEKQPEWAVRADFGK